ncbi:MAG TPA: hypothetical protein DDW50_13880 [Firmicutes bacterium]|jgi:hypothetical protein|nr:hypothetical protein [Bacillota bacterium]
MGKYQAFFKQKAKVSIVVGKRDVKKAQRILVIGYPYFVGRIQELAAGSDYQLLTMPKSGFQRWLTLLRVKAIYLIGGDLRSNRFYTAAVFLRKKLIMHWVGSDILEMKEWLKKGHRFSPLLLKHSHHWAEVDWTAGELQELGIKAQVVPLTPASFPAEVKELPAKFVVLCYLPPEREHFYGGTEMIQLAKQFPDIVFLAVAASPTDSHPDWPENIIPVGWVDDMGELYPEITVLVRFTEHDGLSFMVLEALANGRHVIWSYPFEGVRKATNYAQLMGAISELYQDFQAGKLPLNQPGRAYVADHYRPQAVWQRIYQGINGVLS